LNAAQFFQETRFFNIVFFLLFVEDFLFSREFFLPFFLSCAMMLLATLMLIPEIKHGRWKTA